MVVKCPHCGYEEDVPEEYVGETGICDSCGKEFKVGVVVVSESTFDSQGDANIRCPYCQTENSIRIEYSGRDLRCCECNGKFRVVVNEPARNEQSVNKAVGNPTMTICPYCRCRNAVPDDTPGTIYKCCKCGREYRMLAQHTHMVEMDCSTKIGIVVLFLLMMAGIGAAINNPDNMSGFLAFTIGCGTVIALIIKWHIVSVSQTDIERVKNEARTILAEKEKKEEQERIEREGIEEREKARKDLLEKVVDRRLNTISDPTSFIRELLEKKIIQIRRLRRPESVRYDYFKFYDGEEMYFYATNVDCKVPHPSRTENYNDGTLVITNKRLVFASDDHKQTYRIDNIRDFTPCWLFNINAKGQKGELMVASSEKRREVYSLENSWLPSLLIMFLWNDVFRERILTQEPEKIICNILDKVCVQSGDVEQIIGDMVCVIQQIGDFRQQEEIRLKAYYTKLAGRSLTELENDQIARYINLFERSLTPLTGHLDMIRKQLSMLPLSEFHDLCALRLRFQSAYGPLLERITRARISTPPPFDFK